MGILPICVNQNLTELNQFDTQNRWLFFFKNLFRMKKVLLARPRQVCNKNEIKKLKDLFPSLGEGGGGGIVTLIG